MSTQNIQVTVEQVLQRLLNLETREASREATSNTVIDALKKENHELKREIGAMKKNIDGLVTKVATLESHDIQGITNNLSKVRRQTKKMGIQFNGLSSRTQEIQGRVQHMFGLHRVLSKSLVDRQNVPDLYHKVDGLTRRLDAIAESLEEKTSSLEEKTSSLELIRDDFQQSITRARLEQPTGGLTINGQAVTMNCVNVFGTTGIMDKRMGCLVPKRKGRYVVVVKMHQHGDGVIDMRIRWNKMNGGTSIVQTGRHDDVQCGVWVDIMDKGQTFWVEAVRHKGKATIAWCWVYCWLLSPL